MKNLPRFLLACAFLTLLSGAAMADSVADLLKEAQTAYQKGDMETAKRAFEMVYALDAHNQTAITFLRRIKAAAPKAGGAKERERQLAAVILPQVNFKEATLGSALDYVKQQVAKVTEGKVPLSFVLQVPEETMKTTVVTLSLANVPVTEVLRYVGGLANVTFSYEQFAVVVRAKGAPPVTAQ